MFFEKREWTFLVDTDWTILQELQHCFDSKDIGMLQEVLTAMDPEEAQVWLKKCIDSGLWVPGPSGDGDDAPAPPEQCKSASPHTSLQTSYHTSLNTSTDVRDGARAVQPGPAPGIQIKTDQGDKIHSFSCKHTS